MKRIAPLRSLDDLFSFRNGHAFAKTDWSDRGLPIIRIQNLNDRNAPFNFFRGDPNGHILVEEGDLLFSWSGTVGSSFGPHIWSGKPGLLNQHIFKVSHGEEVERRYAYYALEHITGAIEGAVNGAVGLVHITKEKLRHFTIPLPALADQKRIAGVLDRAFDAISIVKVNTERNLQNVRALFEGHLDDTFSQRAGQWAARRLGEISEVQSGGTPLVSKREYWKGDIPWYSSGELNSLFTKDPERRLTTAGLGNSNAKLFPKGSLLIGMYDTAALKMSILDRDGAFNQAIAGVKPHDDIEMEFILHAINAVKARLLLERRGVRQKNLSLAKIKDFVVPVPRRSEQHAVVLSLRAVFNETERLESIYQQKLAKMDELKQSVLHQAFIGAL